MAQLQFSTLFLEAVKKSQFNSSEWKPCSEKFNLKDLWAVTAPGQYEDIDGDVAIVTATRFTENQTGLRITVPFKDGTSIDLKLSGKSTLVEGDKVKISSITCQELKKAGQENIVRYDGEKA